VSALCKSPSNACSRTPGDRTGYVGEAALTFNICRCLITIIEIFHVDDTLS
jgi:hypothetical protein